MKRLPYSLYRRSTAEPSTDDNGNFVVGTSGASTPGLVLVGACRDEVSRPGDKVVLENGEAYVFAATVFARKDVDTLPIGTYLEVKDGDVVRQAGTVKRFVRTQLHVQIWL